MGILRLELRVSFCVFNFVIPIYGAKFPEHCFNISRDKLFIQYFTSFSKINTLRNFLKRLKYIL